MMTFVWVVLAAASVWALCGVLAYGLTFAHFQGMYPDLAAADYEADRKFAVLVGTTGPLGLVISLSCGAAKYGVKWK